MWVHILLSNLTSSPLQQEDYFWHRRSKCYEKAIVYKKTNEWYIERQLMTNEWHRMVQRMVTSDNEWQPVAQRMTTNDNECYNEWQQVTTSDNEWSWVINQVTTNGNERQPVTTNQWQRVIKISMSDREWQVVVQQLKTNESK